MRSMSQGCGILDLTRRSIRKRLGIPGDDDQRTTMLIMFTMRIVITMTIIITMIGMITIITKITMLNDDHKKGHKGRENCIA
jgi:hypothetical protein